MTPDDETESLPSSALGALDFLVVEGLKLTRPAAGRGWRRSGGERVLLEDLAFTLQKRRSLALVGEDREALFALAAALVKIGPVAAGSINFAGIPVLGFDPQRFRAVRKRIQAVFPDALGQLPSALTVREAFREVLAVWCRRASRDERARLVDAVMIACGLPEAVQDLYPVELDAVERQQVALARALLPGPELLICQGITEGLDTVQRAELCNRVRHLREEFRLTLLVLTDDLAVAHQLGDDIGVLHRGRLVESGPAATLVSRPAHDHTRRLVAAAA
jgi:peptide/nickel transport system ATP-binding protein